MRHDPAILIPLLALAACGRPGLDKEDGSFDRAAFRELYARQCADQSRAMNIPEADAGRICGCITDQLIAASSDEELRTFHREYRVPLSRIESATGRCQHLGPGGARSSQADEEPPPRQPSRSRRKQEAKVVSGPGAWAKIIAHGAAFDPFLGLAGPVGVAGVAGAPESGHRGACDR